MARRKSSYPCLQMTWFSLKRSEDSTKRPLELLTDFGKVSDTKLTYRNQKPLYTQFHGWGKIRSISLTRAAKIRNTLE